MYIDILVNCCIQLFWTSGDAIMIRTVCFAKSPKFFTLYFIYNKNMMKREGGGKNKISPSHLFKTLQNCLWKKVTSYLCSSIIDITIWICFDYQNMAEPMTTLSSGQWLSGASPPDYGVFCNSEEFSDLRITVGDNTYYGHRIVLATASEVFQTMLSSVSCWTLKDRLKAWLSWDIS